MAFIISPFNLALSLTSLFSCLEITSFNSSGNQDEQEEDDIGRPTGSDDEQKQEYDENYNQTRT